MAELAIGWREAVLVAVLVVSLFLGYSVLKLIQLRSGQAGRKAPREADEVWREDIERDVAALRAELDAVRVELGQLRAARQASPHYGEAMSLARSGMGAREIASRCGISVAEAELVRALGAPPPQAGGGNG